MLVRVKEIGAEGLNMDFSYGPEDLPVLAEMQDTGEQKPEIAKSGGLQFIFPVECEVRLSKVAQMIEVSCSARVTVTLQCSRCLENISTVLMIEFSQTYVEELPDITDEAGAEVDLSAEEMGLILFDGEYIDLRDEIQQQIVLAIPAHPLCAEECKGLCLTCGVDLNTEVCDCNAGKVSMHFAALRDFKVDK